MFKRNTLSFAGLGGRCSAGSYDTDDPVRESQVADSLSEYQLEIVSKLGTGEATE